MTGVTIRGQGAVISSSDGEAVAALYRDKVYQNAGNPALLALVPVDVRRVLDVGCGAGDNARALKGRGCGVWGVTLSEAEAELARPHCEAVVVANAETSDLALPQDYYDLLLLSHVVEHMVRPDVGLARLAAHLRPGGLALLAVPNMANYRCRLRLLLGDWRQEDGGPFDRTHYHFWSYHTADDLFRGAPFRVVSKTPGDPAGPLWPLRRVLPRRWAQVPDRFGGRVAPNLFAGQTLVVARRE
jgi:SAM-dependent methyltransferase